MSRMPIVPTSAEIAADATWLVQALDPGSAMTRLVRMDGETYRAASFLDDRMLAEPRETAVLPWADVAAAAQRNAWTNARWIFHIGHVGSTLVSRLLGELPGVLSIREPRILRDIVALSAEQRGAFTGPLQALLSRTFAPTQFALVKATSFVSEIAAELVGSGQRALFMFATPQAYIASILAGENSVKELAALAPSRAERVAGRATLPQPTNAAEAAAAAWACEMTGLEAAAESVTDRHVQWLDFDLFLQDVPLQLAHVAVFFGFETEAQKIGAIANGPLMRRYSKALEYDYSPSLRRDLIAGAEAANRNDIDRALAMLQSASETSPLLARALDRAKEH
jgi:hypothetical protein